MSGADEQPATLASVFASAEFRAMLLAQLLSIMGDQFARVALSVLVFDRTGSAGWAAFTYALTFLPDLLSGPLLSGFADRLPRRQVMVACDVVRAVLVAAMAIPHLPLLWLGVLIVAMRLLNTPFAAARSALTAAVLDGDRYVVGSAVANVNVQTAQLAGFAVGGFVVAVLGSGPALVIDAATFVASAVLLIGGVKARPASTAGEVESWSTRVREGSRLVWDDRRLRAIVWLACISSCYIVAEGLAVPYAHAVHAGAAGAGLLLAALPAGSALGMLALSRLPPPTRLRLMPTMTVLTCCPLIVTWWAPGLAVTIGLWLASGVASGYQLAANAEFVRSVPDARRAQAVGLAMTAMAVTQGVGIVLGGVAATWWGAPAAVGAAGALGVGLALLAGRAWLSANSAVRLVPAHS